MRTTCRKHAAFITIILLFIFMLTACGNANTPAAPKDTAAQEDTAADPNSDPNNAAVQTPPAEAAPDEPVKEDYNPQAEPFAEKETQDTETITGPEQTIMGIITDATKESLAFQTPDGAYYYMTIPSEGVGGNLSMLTVGQMATLSYRGSLDENHAVLTGISSNSMVTGIYVEEYAFAIKIINAVRAMDMKALSDLTNFPVFIDTGNYNGVMNTSGEFEAIELEKIFTEELVDRIVNYNLFTMQYTDAGFVMGEGGPNITFDVDDDGILGIIGINSKARTEAVKKK